ncbi:class I SAM-dependent methyltransferase [Sinimarinibacterium thermocellulolyticum]|uniref:Class I SAM-dependent methyltransferase n=1 Tax=Sinimarinibacterium thermocellulolyticum TaxID=3170016 RepID=A0ABV2ABQ4_9GAMM
MTSKAARISPTAHATGYLWYRLGLSTEALVTPEGKRLDRGFRLLTRLTQALGGVSLEAMMLARHHGIDALLMRAIDEGRVTQVIEIAAGLSARGWRMRRRYGDRLTYVETDLPAMAAEKRRRLQASGLLGERHRVVELDALAEDGPQSLAAVAATLDPAQGTAVITEGLMNYLAPARADALWRRIAAVLARFPTGLYLSDVYLLHENRNAAMVAFGAILQVFVRGRMFVHFDTVAQVRQRLAGLGFAEVRVHATRELPATCDIARTPGGDRVRILEATRSSATRRESG